MQRQRRETAPDMGVGSSKGGPESVEKASGDDWNMGGRISKVKSKKGLFGLLSTHLYP